MEKRIIYLDASALKKSSCLRRIQWHVIDGYTLAQGSWSRNYKAAYGTAFHKTYQKIINGVDKLEAINSGLAFYKDYEQYISKSPKEFRTMEHLESVLRTYFFKRYKVDHMRPVITSEGEPLTEIKFQYPYYEDDEMIVFITGTIDLISNYLGQTCVTDHKVTGAYDIKDFFFDFELNIQSLMYVWMYRQLTGSILPFLVNGIFINKPTEKAMQKGIFDGVTFERNTPIDFSVERIDEFQNYLYSKLDTIIKGFKNGTLIDTPDFASCREPFFSLCPYFNVCRLGKSMHGMLLNSYEKHQYNPLLFQD